MVYGYCRVSTKHQRITRQVTNITELYPEAVIIKEFYTGTTQNRPSWDKLMKQLVAGDTIVFDSVSRMSRNAFEGFNDYKMLYEMGINLIFINEPLINTFLHKLENEKKVVKTPGGNLLETSDEKLAERILADLEEYGTDYMGPISILPWQYTYRDSFYTIPQGEIVKILDECFLQKHDWTFDYRLENVFGFEYERKSNIKTWFEKCSPGQLVAACCIGNAYHSVNVAYVLALLLENYSGDELVQQFDALAKILETQDYYIEDSCITFKTFEGTIRHYQQSYTQFYKYFDREMLPSEITGQAYKDYVNILL